jgi:predicted Zn-dependent protease with MMP-like domain
LAYRSEGSRPCFLGEAVYNEAMAVEISDDDFDEAVSDALDRIPEQFLDALDNIVVLVVDDPPERDLLGLYQGIPLPERDSMYAGVLPDQIFIYRSSMKRVTHSREDLIEQIVVTVVHEIGHYFGLDDDRLHDLGWG